MRLLATTLALLPSLVLAETLTGIAYVVDGDSLEIHGQCIQLQGIDAPENTQYCHKPDGSQWRCGRKAAIALADHIDRKSVRCEGTQHEGDKGLVAICYQNSEELNAWMVRQGWALPLPKQGREYLSQEQQAKADKAGLWSLRFTPPWIWRAEWHVEDTGCKVKERPLLHHQGEAGRFFRFRHFRHQK